MNAPSFLVSSLLVAFGSGMGAWLRFVAGKALGSAAFPLATLGVNVSGSLAMGLLAGWLARADDPQELLLLALFAAEGSKAAGLQVVELVGRIAGAVEGRTPREREPARAAAAALLREELREGRHRACIGAGRHERSLARPRSRRHPRCFRRFPERAIDEP